MDRLVHVMNTEATGDLNAPLHISPQISHFNEDGFHFNPTPDFQDDPLSRSLGLHYFPYISNSRRHGYSLQAKAVGAGSADMNRAAKTRLGCGRHGSG